jgi:hypothetical protein
VLLLSSLEGGLFPIETPYMLAEEARRSIPRNIVHTHTSASSLEAFTRVPNRTIMMAHSANGENDTLDPSNNLLTRE